MFTNDKYNITSTLQVNGQSYHYFSLPKLEERGVGSISKLPFSIKVLLEAAVRQFDGISIRDEHIKSIATWADGHAEKSEIPYKPARIVLQDYTAVAALVDLAAMRSKVKRLGQDAQKINPLVPVDLVIDHSLMVDSFGTRDSLQQNMALEFERNNERYKFMRWAQKAFRNFRVIPPANGIVHQVNLEYLASVAISKEVGGYTQVFPDSVVGTDSHTTMINGLGILGWGVGGIEAEAVMLGLPIYFTLPEVVGFKLTGKLPKGVTATDLALTITQFLRKKGVVGKFVEFYGDGLANLTLADRATISNMSPEYGSTCAYFPVDHESLAYLRLTGRDEDHVRLVEAYFKAQGLFRTEDVPVPFFSDTVELDLSSIEPTLAGPKRPQDRVSLSQVKQSFQQCLRKPIKEGGFELSEKEISKKIKLVHPDGKSSELKTGAVVITAITSCTNTSNPSVMLGAGILAQKAVEQGLEIPAYVKTSLTPGSTVVAKYLQAAGLMEPLEKLGFYLAGFGCATCAGNSGPLPEEVSLAIKEHDLTVSSVLSGNRNFEGRIHPQVKANYLASPPLVVAYALAGTIDIDLATEPLGYNKEGEAVYLHNLWPSTEEIEQALKRINPDMFHEQYRHIFSSNPSFNHLDVPEGELYQWAENSTYIQEPPYFHKLALHPEDISSINGARALLLLGDSITTDHISPAGAIGLDSPAAAYLLSKGVKREEFNAYGSRRGNHEVMMRGTFANIRIRNRIIEGIEGGFTKHFPSGEVMPIYTAAMRYQEEGIPLIVMAGKEYGSGSSRDWAAKGTCLLGVKAVIAQSFERIHRSNLVGMGVLPLQFEEGTNWESLHITGTETFDILGLDENVQPGQKITVKVTCQDGSIFHFAVIVRLDNVIEVEYYRHGGILSKVLRELCLHA